MLNLDKFIIFSIIFVSSNLDILLLIWFLFCLLFNNNISDNNSKFDSILFSNWDELLLDILLIIFMISISSELTFLKYLK